MPSEMILPFGLELPLPGIDGGGGTTAEPAPPSADCVLPEAAYCSATGNSGAGATTCECPMLMSPKRRCEAASKLGAGCTTAACGARRMREDSVSTSGVGATAVCESIGDRRRLAGIVSGAGATAVTGSVGSLRLAALFVDARGIEGWILFCDQATILGRGTS